MSSISPSSKVSTYGLEPRSPISSAPKNARRTRWRGFVSSSASLSAISSAVADPEPLSLMPGPSGTESRCAPTIKVSFPPPGVSAMTLVVRLLPPPPTKTRTSGVPPSASSRSPSDPLVPITGIPAPDDPRDPSSTSPPGSPALKMTDADAPASSALAAFVPKVRDVAPGEVLEASRLAPAREPPGVDAPEPRRHFTCARALHEREVRLPDRGPRYLQVGRPGGQVAGKLEGLDLDLVARFAEPLRDVIGGGVVAGGAGGAVAAGLGGDGLEAPRVREDPVDRHGLAQFGRKTGFGGGGRRFPAARGQGQEAYEQRHEEWGMGWAHAS